MRGIRKTFPGVIALDGVDFDVRAGEVHVLLGENGAGKSTLMKILSGAYAKDAGEILLDGTPVDDRQPARTRRLGIATIYQELSLVPQLTVAENILLGASRRAGGHHRPRALREAPPQPGRGGPRRSIRDAPVRSLGIAEQQMVEVAKALSGGRGCWSWTSRRRR